MVSYRMIDSMQGCWCWGCWASVFFGGSHMNQKTVSQIFKNQSYMLNPEVYSYFLDIYSK